MNNTHRTAITFDIAPDAIEDLLDLPFRFVADADRLIEKIAGGKMETFITRTRPVKGSENRVKISRGKVTLTCMVVGSAVTVVGVRQDA